MKHQLLILTAAAALAASQGAEAQMTGHDTGGGMGDWEFRIGPVFLESKTVDFNGGSNAHIDSTTGVKIGAGYYVTDQLIIGGNFSWAQSSFNGTVCGSGPSCSGINASIENGNVDFSTMMFDATYTFLHGPIRPYGVVGLGWNWPNTSRASRAWTSGLRRTATARSFASRSATRKSARITPKS